MAHLDKLRTIVSIDGSMMQKYMTISGNLIDYSKVVNFIDEYSYLVQANYHLVEYLDDNGKVHPRHEFVSYLQYWGYNVVVKPMHNSYNNRKDQSENPSAVKPIRNFSVVSDLTVTLMDQIVSARNPIDQVVLLIGDSDYIPLVNWLRRQSIKVTIISSLKMKAVNAGAEDRFRMLMSNRLRMQATGFIDINAIYKHIKRDKVAATNQGVAVASVPAVDYGDAEDQAYSCE